MGAADTLRTMDDAVDAAIAEVLPYECWERLKGESSPAYAAFCLFREYGPGRNIKRAMAAAAVPPRHYDMWRKWSMRFQWTKRAGDYDEHLERLKRTEREKSIAEREDAYRAVTGRMLAVVQKKLDTMDPAELAQGNIVEWMKSAIDVEREVLGIAAGPEKREAGQLEIRFSGEFEGL